MGAWQSTSSAPQLRVTGTIAPHVGLIVVLHDAVICKIQCAWVPDAATCLIASSSTVQ